MWPFSKIRRLKEQRDEKMEEAIEQRERAAMAEDLSKAQQKLRFNTDWFDDVRYATRHGSIGTGDWVRSDSYTRVDRGLLGFKKTRRGSIVLLYIPHNARVHVGMDGKCRAEKALVIGSTEDIPLMSKKKAVRELLGEDEALPCNSRHDRRFTYEYGEVAEPEQGFSDGEYAGTCAGGIHFFTSYKKARRW